MRFKIKLNHILPILLIFSILINLPYNLDTHLETNQHSELVINPEVRSSGFWVMDPFVINESGGGNYTWNEAKAEPWCSGSGSLIDPYKIENLTIDAKNMTNGIHIVDSNASFIITNCTIFNATEVLYDAGIRFDNVTNGIIYKNNLSANNEIGIYLNNSYYNLIYENGINHTDYAIILENSNYNNITKNIVNENDWYGVYLDNSNFTTIDNNTADRNIASGFGNGFYIKYSYNTTITNNNMIGNKWFGMTLIDCDNSTVIGNIIKDTIDYDGIVIQRSNYTLLRDNDLSDNGQYGLRCQINHDNIYEYNRIANNGQDGIQFRSNSNNNIVRWNNITNNQEYGIQISSIGAPTANLFYMNNLSGNVLGDAIDEIAGNFWNTSSIGNFYSDYGGSDNNNDGIGDTPYNIPGAAGAIDNFPIIFIDTQDPTVIINIPIENNLYGWSAPSFNVELNDNYYLNGSWYTLDGGLNNYTFTTNGSINPTAWGNAANGTVTIVF